MRFFVHGVCATLGSVSLPVDDEAKTFIRRLRLFFLDSDREPVWHFP